MRFTLIIARQPAELSKAFWLEKGALKNRAAAQMIEGVALRRELRDFETFAALLGKARGHNWALMAGIAQTERARVVTKLALAHNPGAIARSKAHFAFPVGPGLLALDFDPSPELAPMTPHEMRAALVEACPWLRDAAMVITESASSHLYSRGKCLKGRGGLHTYISIDDARAIPKAVDAIFQGTFRAHGFAMISKSGAIFPRTLIDRSSPQPERLLFECGAVLSDDLEQRRPAPVYLSGEMLAARNVPCTLHYKHWRATDARWLAMKDAAGEKAAQARQAWITERLATGKTSLDTLRRALTDGELADDFEVTLPDGRVMGVRAVPEGSEIRDPLEPDYRGCAPCAIVYRWGIYSQAHGGYSLRWAREAKLDRILRVFENDD